MVLPYLMEFPYECTEQTFNRLYANALARHIANSDPKIRRIFNLWKKHACPRQPTRKEPGPESGDDRGDTVAAAGAERKPGRAGMSAFCSTDNRHRMTRPNAAYKSSPSSNSPRAHGHGFPAARPTITSPSTSRQVSGRLRHLGADIDVASAIKSLGRLDNWINNIYREILKNPSQRRQPSQSTHCPVPLRP